LCGKFDSKGGERNALEDGIEHVVKQKRFRAFNEVEKLKRAA
jgi:hypothetical protein